MAEQAARVFKHAGFSQIMIDYAAGSVVAYAIGATTPEAAWRASLRRAGMSAEDWKQSLQEHVAQAAAEHPEPRDILRHHAKVDPQVARQLSFDFGLVALLDGLEVRLRSPHAEQPPQPEQAPAEHT